MSEATDLPGHVISMRLGPAITATEDAILEEFISGTWSSYGWSDVINLIHDNPRIMKILFEYGKHVGKIGPNKEYKGI